MLLQGTSEESGAHFSQPQKMMRSISLRWQAAASRAAVTASRMASISLHWSACV